MSKYGYSIYGGSKYGLTPRLPYSVEPMGINVIKFHEVFVSWQTPTGTFSRFRLVRNQNNYPETADDGVVIFEQISPDGSSLEGLVSRSSIYDGLENPTDYPINPGRNIFYKVFLFTADNVWVKAGQIEEIVPADTGAMGKSINLLPRVLTSQQLSPLGTIDEASTLYQFLDGMMFTYEQMLTEIKLARPVHNLEIANYRTIPAETLSLGLNPEPNLPASRQRALIREAIPMYANKGTALGLADYAESLTGFAPTITVANNLMLSIQDCTFINSTGRWVATGCTISSTDEMVPSSKPLAIDNIYTLKVESTGSGVITLGADDPIRQGVPVSAETDYVFNFDIKCPTTGNFSYDLEFFDKDGVSTGVNSYSNTAGNSWSTESKTITTPTSTSYMTWTISFTDIETYYIDHFQVGLDPVTAYEDARVVNVELAPKLENYITNPSFEVNATGWTLTGVSFTQNADVPVVGYPGSYSGKFVATGNWTLACNATLPIETGVYFTASYYIKSSNITSVNAVIKLYDESDTLIDTITEARAVTGSWERDHVSVLIPSTSTAKYAKFKIEGTAGTFYLDMVMAQDTFAPSDYFDGNMPELVGAVWSGTANQSSSLLYPTKSTKLLRLAQTMVDWLPMNSWWRISTPAGLEYTNLDV